MLLQAVRNYVTMEDYAAAEAAKSEANSVR